MSSLLPLYAAMAGAGGSVDPYAAYVKMLIPMQGTNASTTFTDQKGRTMTAYNGAQISTSFTPSAGKFTGLHDYIAAANDAAFAFGTQDFCIEAWVNCSQFQSNGNRIFDSSPAAGATHSTAFYLDSQGYPSVYAYDYGFATVGNYSGSPKPAINTWAHVAFVRNGNFIDTYVDGTKPTTYGTRVSVATWTNMLTASGICICGYLPSPTLDTSVSGYMGDLRITVGVPRYTGNFTPPVRGSI